MFSYEQCVKWRTDGSQLFMATKKKKKIATSWWSNGAFNRRRVEGGLNIGFAIVKWSWNTTPRECCCCIWVKRKLRPNTFTNEGFKLIYSAKWAAMPTYQWNGWEIADNFAERASQTGRGKVILRMGMWIFVILLTRRTEPRIKTWLPWRR